MKKLLLLLILAAITLFSAGCSDIAAQLTADTESEEEAGTETAGEDAGEETDVPSAVSPLALITGSAGVEDDGYAAAAWAGLSKYAEESGLAAAFYPAEEEALDSRLAAVAQAVGRQTAGMLSLMPR